MHSDSDPSARPETGDEARRQVKDAVGEVKTQGRRLAEQARRGAVRMADEKKQAAADYVLALASVVGSSSQELERQGLQVTTSYAAAAADELNRLGRQISGSEPSELLRDLEGFARRRPALFFGAAFIAGIGLTRFLKSSASQRQSDSSRLIEHG